MKPRRKYTANINSYHAAGLLTPRERAICEAVQQAGYELVAAMIHNRRNGKRHYAKRVIRRAA